MARKHYPRLIRDAIRLRKRRGELAEAAFVSRRAKIHRRLRTIIDADWPDKHARRLVKRLKRHQNELFTFLNQLDIPSDNNHAEREIQPAVIIRKNSYGNRSARGAETQEILMTVLRTL